MMCALLLKYVTIHVIYYDVKETQLTKSHTYTEVLINVKVCQIKDQSHHQY